MDRMLRDNLISGILSYIDLQLETDASEVYRFLRKNHCCCTQNISSTNTEMC
jgi:hypothetical protein